MGMIMAILGGFLAVILGFIGLIFWFSKFIVILQGTIPLILVIGGLIALFIGITEVKDTLKSKEEETRFDTSFQEEPKPTIETPAQEKEEKEGEKEGEGEKAKND